MVTLSAREPTSRLLSMLGSNTHGGFPVCNEKGELTAERKADQAAIDGAIKCPDMMKKYLKAKFTLSKRDAPHKMIF